MQEEVKDFVTSRPAAGALFTIVLGELCDFSVAAFRRKIERYAEGGGDGGLTRTTMRATCGLTWPSTRTAPVTGLPLGRAWDVVVTVAARQVPGWLLGDEEGLVRCHVSLVKHCLGEAGTSGSEYHVSRLHQDVWPRVPARDRVGTLRQLKARGWWKELPPRGRAGAPLIPHISMERGVLDLFKHVPDGAEPVAHRETLSADPCVSWCECVALFRHLTKLQEACDAKAKHRGRGVMNAMDEVEKEKWAAKALKYRSHLAWMTAVRDQVAIVETDNMADFVLSQGGTTIANLVRYQQEVGNLGRRYSSPLGAQRCSNLVRAHVLPPSENFDIENAMTNLVVQAVRTMDLRSWLPSRELSSWSHCADHTTAIRGRLQGFLSAKTKAVILGVAHGRAVPDGTRGIRALVEGVHVLSFCDGSSRPRSPGPRIPPSPVGDRPLRTGCSCARRRSRGRAPPVTSRATSTASWCTGTSRR